VDALLSVAEIVVASGIVLVLFIMWRRTRERRRRWRLNLCPHCGYDIRHCGERCSECGEVIAEEWRDMPG
jgi:hypothetical protein